MASAAFLIVVHIRWKRKRWLTVGAFLAPAVALLGRRASYWWVKLCLARGGCEMQAEGGDWEPARLPPLLDGRIEVR